MLIELGIAPFDYELDFTIPEADNVGLFLSGGLDSAALLCLIIEELNNTNRANMPIHIWTCNKPPDPVNGARMVDIISREYNRELIYHNNYDVSEEAKANGVFDFQSTRDAYNQFDSIKLYMAGNNSWEKTQWSDQIPLSYDINSTITGVTLPWSYPEEPHVIYPFLNMIKSQMIDVYYKLGKEHLIQYTYSCSRQDPPACHECYSCEEAAMGFELLNKTRPNFVPH